MNFIAVKDLKTPRLLRQRLQKEQTVLLTNNGKPMAIMLNVNSDEDPDAILQAVRETRSRMALQQIRETARAKGSNRMNLDDINLLIDKTRKTRRSNS
jgi:hypothetical protein